MHWKPQSLGLFLMLPLAGALLAADAPPRKAVELPVLYSADRFFATPVTAKGETLHLYTDSAGGQFLSTSAVKRLGLKVKETVPGDNEGETYPMFELPPFRPGAGIPLPLVHGGLIPTLPEKQEKQHANDFQDGLLGQAWFSGRVWTWDYPGHKLLWLPDGGLPAVDPSHRVALGFKADGFGKRLLDFPRLQATIDGETLDLLFDTGAMVVLGPEALAKLGDKGPSIRGTSFIVATRFDAWRKKHPGWRVIEKADQNMKGEPMIEVPTVTVAGYTVGPVWFTRRADPNFHGFMSQFTDKQVEGALGGSALKFFRVTVDYPNAVAAFERP
jgi:hypothetical protein